MSNNDINTLNGATQEAIDRLVNNLQEMGIYDAEFDPDTGLFGLIDMVKMIAPSMTNIELDTSITCTCPSTASVGVPFTITGVLSATYDDKSVSNVDLTNARLNGATVELYDGDTLLTTTTTDSNGNYTYAYTPLSTGTLSLKAVYDSSNDYYDDSASSSVSVVVHVAVHSLSLDLSVYDSNDDLISSGSSSGILSYVDGDYAVLSATALDENDAPIVGETVSFDIINSSTGAVIENIGSDVTDSNGVCSVSYQSKGTGDITIQASCNNISSSSVSIEDCLYAPKLDGTETLHQIQGTTTISNGVMSGGSGFIVGIPNSDNWVLTAEINMTTDGSGFVLYKTTDTTRDTNCAKFWGTFRLYSYVNGSESYQGGYATKLLNQWVSITITKNGTSISVQRNNESALTGTWSLLTSESSLGVGIDSLTGVCQIKNIKVKPL